MARRKKTLLMESNTIPPEELEELRDHMRVEVANANYVAAKQALSDAYLILELKKELAELRAYRDQIENETIKRIQSDFNIAGSILKSQLDAATKEGPSAVISLLSSKQDHSCK